MSAKVNAWMLAAVASLAVIAACAGAGQVADSPETRQELAHEIVRLEIESGDLDQRLNRGADLAQAYSIDTLELELGRELTERELDQVRGVMRSVLGEFLTPAAWEQLLAEVYATHFSAPELSVVLAFFESPAGSKILRLSAELSEEIDDRTETQFEGRMEEFVGRVDEELAKVFPALQEGGS